MSITADKVIKVSPSQNQTIKHVCSQRTFTDNRSEILAQAKLVNMIHSISNSRRFLNNNSKKTLQWKIGCTDPSILPLIDQIRDHSVYKLCEESNRSVLIQTGFISETIPNTETGNVTIKLKQEHIESGLIPDKTTSIPLEDTGLKPIYDIKGKYETIKKFVVGGPVKNLSGATILLHEMGHAIQYINAHEQYKPDKLLENSMLRDTSSLKNDIAEVNLKSANWVLRVYDLDRMGHVLHDIKGALEGSKNDELSSKAEQIDDDRMLALDKVKLWLEHDVMINIEHQFAAKRVESMRLRHGEEMDRGYISVKPFSEGHKFVDHDITTASPLPLEECSSLEKGKKNMIDILVKGSEPLLEMIPSLLSKFDNLMRELGTQFAKDYLT